MAEQDIWSRWLLERRFGGNRQAHQQALEDYLYPIRDQILSRAAIQEGETILDIGCGDGLLAFGALQKHPDVRVIFNDISTELLDVCRSIAAEIGALDRCNFTQAPADDLHSVGGQSVDVVTTRAVLIYVQNKQKAFDEFFRVLKPGGRISIFEPINRFGYPPPENILAGYDLSTVAELVKKVKAVFSAYRSSEASMIDFDERDLLHCAEKAGFSEVHLEYRADIQPQPFQPDWNTFIKTAFNPNVPTLEEAVSQSLSPEEAVRFYKEFQHLFETARPIIYRAQAHIWARKG